MTESTTEDSGPPVTETGPVRPPVIITPPPLSPSQVEKIVKAVEAVEEVVKALGPLYGDYCKWVLSKIKPIIIPPIGPTIPPP
jgi:hypothetical protein